MKLLAIGEYCSSDILKELARTPSMRDRMRKVGFIASADQQMREVTRTGSRGKASASSENGVPCQNAPRNPASVWKLVPGAGAGALGAASRESGITLTPLEPVSGTDAGRIVAPLPGGMRPGEGLRSRSLTV